jgi:uncharacterized damage-inducible protein DinB
LATSALALADPLRHNTWATARLLESLRELSDDQLGATSPGAYGTILTTMEHTVRADHGYQSRFMGRPKQWPAEEDGWATVADLEEWNRRNAAGWEDFLAEDFDPERVIGGTDTDGSRWEMNAGMYMAQVLNHGNEHRGQVCTILTTLGIQPPELDGWAYGEATGRFRELGPA